MDSVYSILVAIVAIIFIFLYSIQKFSSNSEAVFHNDIKKVLHKWTKIPIIGALIGFAITAVIQSSTAVSVLLVAMTRSRLITLAGALSVIIGANLGSTVATQLLSFKILDLAPYIIILGFFLMRTKTRLQKYGESIFYFGIIFSCLYLISVLVHPFSESPAVIHAISLVDNIWMGILVGFLMTNILQSSTLMASIIVIFASKGLLNFDQSFAMILGANIGTTTTALLASLASNRDGKRVALAHFLFSFLGVIIVLPMIDVFRTLIQALPIPFYSQVAVSHFSFNFVIAVISLIMFRYYYKLLFILLPAKD